MPQESLKLPSHFSIEPELLEQLGARAGHQRCIEGHDELLLIIHEVPKGIVPENALVFWRRHDGRWTQAGGQGIDELVGVLERYEGAIGSRYAEVNQAEDTASVFAALRHAGPLLRSVRDLIKAFEQVLAFDPNDRDVRTLRDRAKEIELAADLLQSDARATLEFLRSRQGDELLRATETLRKLVSRLVMLTVVFLPLTAMGTFLTMSGALPVVVKVFFWVLFGLALLALGWPVLARRGLRRLRMDREGG